MLCLVCENISIDTQKYTKCGWEFINFTEEPTQEEQNEYIQLLDNYRTEYYFNLAQLFFQEKNMKKQ